MWRFGPIGDALRFLLEAIYKVVPNYGWAVILFTLAIRLILLPLEIKSKRGMRRQQQVQPKIDALNKKYAQDKEKLQQKTSELYKQEKINPLSGCLPMLIQLPILFAMYAVMREVANEKTVSMILSVKEAFDSATASGDMTQFLNFRPVLEGFLWIKNVFQPDSFMSAVVPAAETALQGFAASGPITEEMLETARLFLTEHAVEYTQWTAAMGNEAIYSAPLLMWTISIPQVFNGLFILPVLAAVSQFVSTKFLSPAQSASSNNSGKSNNQLMKYFFPLFSLWICSSSNAAFALYWVAVNLIQIVQQFAIDKFLSISEQRKKLSEEADKP